MKVANMGSGSIAERSPKSNMGWPRPSKHWTHMSPMSQHNKDAKGKRIEDLVDSYALCVLNDGSYTYMHPANETYSAIHLSIVQPELAMDFLWRLCGSDHFPIILNCEGSCPVEWEQFRQADWPTFWTLCCKKLTLDISVINSFIEMLRWIAEKTVPMTSATPKHLMPPWLDDNCKRAIKGRKKTQHSTGDQLMKI